jgi:FSR family fosmidomycin resistance protein-like MFS transporter
MSVRERLTSTPVESPAPESSVSKATRRPGGALWLMFLSHLVDDIYQGAVPALLPFWVAERDYSYAAATGITLAATFLSSLVQPAFGVLTDRYRLWWLSGVGLLVAGLGVGLSGLGRTYELTWLAIALSGLGVAAYHPEAARATRGLVGSSAAGLSVFTVGGNVGFALAPLLVTPTMLALGTAGTPFLALPAVLIGPALLLFLARLHRSAEAGRKRAAGRTVPVRRDDWRAFSWLTVLVICRSMVFFGVTSLLSLYVIRHLGGDTVAGGTALTVLLASGTFATVAGGWLADRRGRLFPVRLAYSLVVPALIGMLLAPSIPLAVACAAVLGVAIYLPFSVQTTRGQEYLPKRLGTASGVTLGLAVSAGGMFVPLLGMLADQHGLPTALAALLAFPLVALLCTTQMYDPARRLDPLNSRGLSSS